jgi:phosphocarrier protein
MAKTFSSSITVAADDLVADAKDVLEVMMLAAFPGTLLRFEAHGPDAQVAVDALVDLVTDDFGLG